MRWTEPGWRSTLAVVTASTLIGAAFPPPVHWLRWPTRLSPRGRLLYVAFNALLGFGIREVARRSRLAHEQAVTELRAQLGREPTDQELHTHLGRRILRDHLGREPTERELRDALHPGRR